MADAKTEKTGDEKTDEKNKQPGFLANAASRIAAVYRAITRDGTWAAAWRQGADEIGQALKAFPDSIQVQETGTILNPTPGEIASARDPERQSLRGANDNRVYDQEQEQAHERHHSRGR